LALNSMTQPSGMVCGFPSAYGFFLRSSPFMCVFDTLYILAQLAVYGFRDPRNAWATVVQRRFSRGDQGALQSLQKNTPFRIIIFLFSISQIVKLFACVGIPLTQTFGGMYLGSFVIIEILIIPTSQPLRTFTCRFFGRSGTGSTAAEPLATTLDPDDHLDEDEDGPQEPKRHFLLNLVWPVIIKERFKRYVELNLDSPITQLDQSGHEALPPPPRQFNQLNILLRDQRIEAWVRVISRSVSSGVPFSIALGRVMAGRSVDWTYGTKSFPIILVYPAISIVHLFAANEQRMFLSTELLSWFWFSGIFSLSFIRQSIITIMVVSAVPTTTLLYFEVADIPRRFHRLIRAYHLQDLDLYYFLVQNVVASLLCYCYLYDPQWTFKPVWVEQLG